MDDNPNKTFKSKVYPKFATTSQLLILREIIEEYDLTYIWLAKRSTGYAVPVKELKYSDAERMIEYANKTLKKEDNYHGL
jgi:hypothetical protein